MVEQLHKIPRLNFERLTQLIKGRIAEGKLEDVRRISITAPPGRWCMALWRCITAVLEQCAGRSGRLLPVPDGYWRAHGQQAQARG